MNIALSLEQKPDSASVYSSTVARHFAPDVALGEATLEFEPRPGWRSFLKGLGISAAVILCEVGGASGIRHAYLVGLAEAKPDRSLTLDLIALAERISQDLPTTAFARLGSPEVLADYHHSDALKRFLSQWGCAAILKSNGGANRTRALFFRESADGAFGAEVERQLREATPLFQEAAVASALTAQSERRAALLAAMFDQVALATMLVDQGGRVLFVNNAGQSMLTERRFVLLTGEGMLACARPDETRALKKAIRHAASGEAPSNERACFRIGDPDGEWRLAVVAPASDGALDSEMAAMVLIQDPEVAQAPTQMLSALGLLPSEQRFLEAFLTTDSLTQAAEQCGLTDETARTYMKRVRGKLGVHRQLELARLIYGLAAPLRTPEANQRRAAR